MHLWGIPDLGLFELVSDLRLGARTSLVVSFSYERVGFRPQAGGEY